MLNLARTKITPEIVADEVQASLRIVGESYPENPVAFFAPLMEWMRNFVATEHRPLTITFDLSYFNTSTSKCLLDLLDMLEQHRQQGYVPTVEWRYKSDDEDMLESGKELEEDLGLSFQFVAYP